MIVVELFMIGVVAAVLGGWFRFSRRRRSGGGHDEPGREAQLLRRIAFGAMAVVSAFVGLFVAGETFADPGGWEAVALVSVWAVPLVVVAALAWRHPDLGLRVLGALVAALVVVSVWFALDPDSWRGFEDEHGPVRTIATFAIAAALALLGLRRPGCAGLALVVLAVVPPVVCSLGSRAGLPSLVAVATVPMLAGVLYLLSAWVGRGGPPRYGPAR